MKRLVGLLLLLALGLPLRAEAEALIDPARTMVIHEGRDRGKPRPMMLQIGLSETVPFRVSLIDGPPRLVVDLDDTEIPAADSSAVVRWGPGTDGEARAVVTLPHTMRVESARVTGDVPTLAIRMVPVPEAEFQPRADALTVLRGLPEPVRMGDSQMQSALADGRLRVVIDPGHGGIDSGALVEGVREAELMLTVAKELAAVLQVQGIEAVLTRDDNRFVPLEHRTTVARAKAADLFISLHADALPSGAATGVTIYTWDPQSNDRAARQLALHHDRSDLLAGLDLTNTDEDVSRALMDLARLGTQPRSQAAAKHLVATMNEAGVTLHRIPVRGAAFSVLKSPDIPSLLIELGFLTDAGDRANLLDPQWRARITGALAKGVRAWAKDDSALTQAVPGSEAQR